MNDVMKQDFPLIMVAFDRGFIEAETAAECAWLEDCATAMEWYKANVEEARTILHEQEFVSLDAYLQTLAYDRPDGGTIDVEGLAAVQDRMLERGLPGAADPDELVYPGVTALSGD